MAHKKASARRGTAATPTRSASASIFAGQQVKPA